MPAHPTFAAACTLAAGHCARTPPPPRRGVGRGRERYRLLATAALTAITLAQTATPAAAADKFWNCPTNNFTNGNCWSIPGTVVSTDNLLIRPNGANPLIVNFPGTANPVPSLTIQSLTVTGSGGSGSAPTLNISSGTLNMRNYFEVGGGAAVRQTGGLVSPASMNMRRQGEYILSGGRLATTEFNNSGAMLVNGSGFLSAGTMQNSGVLIINGGGGARASTHFLVNSGVMQLNGADLFVARFATNESGAQIIGNRSTMQKLLRNNGIVQATGGTFLLQGQEQRWVLENNGELRVANSATLSVASGLTNAAAGVINLNGVDTGNGPQATLSNGNFGTVLNNSGTLQGAGVVAMPVNHQGRLIARAGGTLTFSESFTSAAGSVMVSDGALRFDGPASFHNGAFISGGGATSFNNTLSVGDAGAAARMTVLGNVFLGGTYFADILGTDAGIGHDQLVVGGRLTLAPGSVLKLGSGSFVAQAGQSFNLLDWGTLDGVFGRVDTSAMQLADGAALDMSRLYVDGTLAVVAVPEPATWAMTIAGMLGLLVRRRMARGLPPLAST